MEKLQEVLSISATIVAPIIAIQITRWLDRRKRDEEQQLSIFRTLMATRATNLDSRHIEALNVIDVVFGSKKQANVRMRWKEYLDHLNSRHTGDSWEAHRIELLSQLLYEISQSLGFKYDKVHIKNQSYLPQQYNDNWNYEVEIRKAFHEILAGNRSLLVSLKGSSCQEQGAKSSDSPSQ